MMRAASALPAVPLHALLQSACFAAMSSETSTFAFFQTDESMLLCL